VLADLVGHSLIILQYCGLELFSVVQALCRTPETLLTFGSNNFDWSRGFNSLTSLFHKLISVFGIPASQNPLVPNPFC
jgi:hypothetical protein